MELTLDDGRTGNTALTADFILAPELPRDAVIVVQETEYTGAGKHSTAQLTFARELGGRCGAGTRVVGEAGASSLSDEIEVPRSGR